jgi:hypothetical protein
MRRNVAICRWWCLMCSLFGTAAMAPAATAYADMMQYPILSDAQLDSRDATSNFGASTSVKVVVNGTDGSLSRAVFQIPSAVWDTAGIVVSAKVYFYVWDDQTLGRDVRLHPLTQGFVEGTGTGSVTGDGATWLSYDGTNLWNAAGGDYDALVGVDAVKPSDDFGWFTWDITAMWNDPNLRSFGGILKMSDESDPGYPNQPRAPLSSSESTKYPHPYVEVTSVPEPCSGILFLAGSILMIGVILRRGRLPAMT